MAACLEAIRRGSLRAPAEPTGARAVACARPAAAFLIERDAVGIAVDTLSLDHGISRDFPTPSAWLPTGRWGLEAVANLGALPPLGATIVVGGPKIKGATGGPSRVLAPGLVQRRIRRIHQSLPGSPDG